MTSIFLVTVIFSDYHYTASSLCSTHTRLSTVLQSPFVFAQVVSSKQNALSPSSRIGQIPFPIQLGHQIGLVFSVSGVSVIPLVSISAS